MAEKEKVGMHLKKTWKELTAMFPTSLPHYKKKEVETLRRFVMLGYLPGDYSFDVRLPYELTEREKEMAPAEQRMMMFLKSMRIDAVVETADEIWIMEVAKGLELSYTGKLLGYTDLYKRVFHPRKPVRMGVVAVDDNAMARGALERMGVKIWLVKP